MKLLNRTVNTNGEAVHFRDKVRWIKVDTFDMYSYRHSLGGAEEWKTVNILQNITAEVVADDIRTTIGRFQGSIKKSKLDDMKKQLPYFPEVYRDFYLSLESCEKVHGEGQ
jgi:hypothetical protein